MTAVGADRLNGAVLKFDATVSDNWNYQSDRPWYPPHLVQYIRRQAAEHLPLTPWTRLEGLAPPPA